MGFEFGCYELNYTSLLGQIFGEHRVGRMKFGSYIHTKDRALKYLQNLRFLNHNDTISLVASSDAVCIEKVFCCKNDNTATVI